MREKNTKNFLIKCALIKSAKNKKEKEESVMIQLLDENDKAQIEQKIKTVSDETNSLKSDLFDYIENVSDLKVSKNLFNSYTEGYQIYADGTVSSNSDRFLTDYIDIFGNVGKYLTFSGKFNGTPVSRACTGVAFFDKNKNVINGGTNSQVTNISIPDNACYVRIASNLNFLTGSNTDLQIEITEDGVYTNFEPYFEPFYVVKTSVIDGLKIPTKTSELLNDSGYLTSENAISYDEYNNLFDKENVHRNSILNGGADGNYTGAIATDYITVESYQTISWNFIPNVVNFYNASKQRISYSQSSWYYQSIPSECAFVRVMFASNESTYFKSNNPSWTMEELIENLIITNGSGANVVTSLKNHIESPFSNEIWDSLGDSLTEARKYQQYVSAHLGLKGYHCNGIGGTRVSGNATNAFWQDVRINSLCPIADRITIAGGTNDVGKSDYSDGELSLDNFDTNTFVGAYNTAIYKILYRYGMATDSSVVDISGIETVEPRSVEISIITPPYNDNGNDNTHVANLVKEIAKMWGYTCIDSLTNMGINKFNADLYFSESDRTHFQMNAHERWARVMIGEYMKNHKLIN